MDKQRFFSSGLLKKYLLGIANPLERARVYTLLHRHPEWKKEVCNLEIRLMQWVRSQHAAIRKNFR